MTVKYLVPINDGQFVKRTSRAHRIGGDCYRFVAIINHSAAGWSRTHQGADKMIRDQRNCWSERIAFWSKRSDHADAPACIAQAHELLALPHYVTEIRAIDMVGDLASCKACGEGGHKLPDETINTTTTQWQCPCCASWEAF